MATNINHKVTSLPTTKENNAFYYVKNGNFVDAYLTDTSGTAKTIINDARITALITTALANQGKIEIVANITARNALNLTSDATVLVLDASGDSTVTSGGATYVYQRSNTTWHKIAEHESQDIALTWANISGKPASSTADIDDAVNKKHTHGNLAVLNKLTETSGEPYYNGIRLNSWSTLAW